MNVQGKQDIEDALRVLSYTGVAARCNGGRIIVKGLVCLICGRDNSFEECGAPKRKKQNYLSPSVALLREGGK